MSDGATRVALIFVQRRLNVYVRFGHPVGDRCLDTRRRVMDFAPRSIFCRVRWEANEFGTTCWQLAVLEATPRGEPQQRIAGISPGATILLHADGPRAVQSALRLFDSIEGQSIDPAEVPINYWRTAQNRLAANEAFTPYTFERHATYLAYRELA